jgi:probable F420-dependent oxidoreductase
MNTFRFGVQMSSALSGRAWREQARRAEALGYSTLHVPDHFDEQWGPWVALTVAAEATERLNVGALVFDNDYRHPMVLAKEAATLDLVSEGRFEMGLGAGWLRRDYEAAGIPYDAAPVRVDRMSESVQVLKRLWSGAPTDHAGGHYSLVAAECHPRPLTRPHPTLCIGGGGRRVLGIAAREADIVGFNASFGAGHVGPEAGATAGPARFDDRVRWVQEAAGARFPALELQCNAFATRVTTRRSEAASEIGRVLGLSAAHVLDVPILLVGGVEDLCEVLISRRERWGFSYWVVNGDVMDSFAPVVARLAGR